MSSKLAAIYGVTSNNENGPSVETIKTPTCTGTAPNQTCTWDTEYETVFVNKVKAQEGTDKNINKIVFVGTNKQCKYQEQITAGS